MYRRSSGARHALWIPDAQHARIENVSVISGPLLRYTQSQTKHPCQATAFECSGLRLRTGPTKKWLGVRSESKERSRANPQRRLMRTSQVIDKPRKNANHEKTQTTKTSSTLDRKSFCTDKPNQKRETQFHPLTQKALSETGVENHHLRSATLARRPIGRVPIDDAGNHTRLNGCQHRPRYCRIDTSSGDKLSLHLIPQTTQSSSG